MLARHAVRSPPARTHIIFLQSLFEEVLLFVEALVKQHQCWWQGLWGITSWLLFEWGAGCFWPGPGRSARLPGERDLTLITLLKLGVWDNWGSHFGLEEWMNTEPDAATLTSRSLPTLRSVLVLAAVALPAAAAFAPGVAPALVALQPVPWTARPKQSAPTECTPQNIRANEKEGRSLWGKFPASGASGSVSSVWDRGFRVLIEQLPDARRLVASVARLRSGAPPASDTSNQPELFTSSEHRGANAPAHQPSPLNLDIPSPCAHGVRLESLPHPPREARKAHP